MTTPDVSAPQPIRKRNPIFVLFPLAIATIAVIVNLWKMTQAATPAGSEASAFGPETLMKLPYGATAGISLAIIGWVVLIGTAARGGSQVQQRKIYLLITAGVLIALAFI